MTPSLAKTSSHEILRRYEIQINESLPEIEPREELHPQDARSVAIRCVVLNHVIGIGFDGDVTRLKGLLEEFDLYQYASPTEQDLLSRHAVRRSSSRVIRNHEHQTQEQSTG